MHEKKLGKAQVHQRPGADDILSDANFNVRHDDFSIQVSIPDDRKFWLRVLRRLEDIDGKRTLTISDLSRGSQTPRVAGAVLENVMTLFSGTQQFLILDIYPSWQLDPRFEVELEKRASFLRSALEFALKVSGLNFSMNFTNDKYNLIISIESN